MTFIQILFTFLFNLVGNFFFFQKTILEHLHFCLANHACVSHLLHGQPHLLECYYPNCVIGTHVCTSSMRMISFFTDQCELFTSCNVSNNASLVSAWTGGVGRVVNQIWTGLNRGRGSQKLPNFYGHPLWITPYLTLIGQQPRGGMR